ncbi:NEW3 domain-containing protein [Haloglomus litoreum]|uniref:COG1361 S-layer family protein n=1 Tax=Haloglomus litoreum TaxID=3034026 RepID=UPI0023E8DD9A|nr:NEW3 domain-containing protein [Haloglomus sp. DT116]
MSSGPDSSRFARASRVLLVLALVSSTVAAAAVPAAAYVEGKPDISVTLSDGTVQPGAESTLELTLVNSGKVEVGASGQALAGKEQVVTTARGTVVRVEPARNRNPIEVKTGEVAVGSVPEGARPVPIQVSVPENAEPGTYELDVEVEYEHYDFIPGGNVNKYGEEQRTKEFTVEVTVEETARFEVVDTTTNVPVGGSGAVNVTVANVGNEAASDASLSLQSTNAALTFGGTPTAESYVGEWAPGERRSVTVGADVASTATTRSLAIATTVSYEDVDGDAQQASLSTGVVPRSEQRFTLASAETSAAIGDQGRLTVALTNTGDRTLDDATVRLESSNAALTFGGSPTARTFVGEWAPNETREFQVEAGFAPSAEERSYALDATVSYTNPSGRTERTDPVTVGVRPAPEQSFDLGGHETALRVGEEGELTGRIVNEGPGEVENAVLVLEPPANVVTAEREYAIGDLGPRSSAEFRYDVEVSSEAREGPRQFTYRLRYEDDGGDTVTSDPLYARGSVAQQRDTFSVDTNASLAAGSSETIEVQVTNEGDEPLTAVSAKLFADAPIGASNDEAFVEELGPGATETLTFRISAAGSAIPKPYPVSLDFQYDEPDGDTKISDSYQVAIDVTERQGGGLLSTFVVPGGLGGAGLGLGVVLSLGGLAAVGLGLVGRRE